MDVLQNSAKTPPVSTSREALARTPWLAAVPVATLDRLAELSMLHRMPPNSVLFEQAESPAFAQLLVQGSIELLAARGAEETLVEFVRAPDLLLPAAVLNQQPYLLRARVLDEATLVMIQAEAFRQAVVSDRALCLAVLACQAAQFRRQIKHAKNLQLRSAEERVGCYLLRLTEDATPGQPVRLPLEKRLIASQLGMTRETFSRTLATLARHGLRVEGDLVHLENAAAARARFQLDPLLDGPEPMLPLQIQGI
ncbi:MAG TPA: helix-turn-helix domain-containing protein [Alphaproteobacteria bacterium]|jgi:CRP/FNR family transcriptional activator FtrB|nr:helix-turn-helix domain-containing protein [Alphaproteobacteria bacterium]